MSIGIGFLELAVAVVTSFTAFYIYRSRRPNYRWGLVGLGCLALAAILTPADVASTLVFASAFAAVYFVGTKHT
ncbi:MAG TPA: hypothetical protein DDW52_25195 [Planctomycetaceae bacterium]|nr:hypothetical protein [Planctomycetaceae bacterium]